MKLTNNFSLEEFECKCGCKMPEFVKKNVIELADNLQVLRNVVGRLDPTYLQSLLKPADCLLIQLCFSLQTQASYTHTCIQTLLN